MKTAAIVPVKSLHKAKTRLCSVLTGQQRERLVLDLLDHVLGVLRSVNEIDQVYLVSPDVNAALVAARHSTEVVDSAEPLNSALGMAISHLRSEDADSCLIVLGDLPLLEPSDVSAILSLRDHEHCVVAAPDRFDRGTNLLLLTPPHLVPPRFGTSSFSKHKEAACKMNVPFRVYRSERTAFDLDTPEDLARFERTIPTKISTR